MGEVTRMLSAEAQPPRAARNVLRSNRGHRGVRRCENCNQRIASTARADAKTCSQECRQKRARRLRREAHHASRKAGRARRKRLLTNAAIDRSRIDCDAAELIGASATSPTASPSMGIDITKEVTAT